MNYGGPQYSNMETYNEVTPLDQLPDLEEFSEQSHNPYVPSGMNQQYQKFIRPSNNQPYVESGMAKPNKSQHTIIENLEEKSDVVASPIIIPQHSHQPTCLEICNHISSCPLCSKFYDNDKSIYVIVIIVLTIICLLLLKRVLNV